MRLSTYIAVVSVFWLIVLSVTSCYLAFGGPQVRQQYKQITVLLIVLAWLSVVGAPVYEWLRVRVFG